MLTGSRPGRETESLILGGGWRRAKDSPGARRRCGPHNCECRGAGVGVQGRQSGRDGLLWLGA